MDSGIILAANSRVNASFSSVEDSLTRLNDRHSEFRSADAHAQESVQIMKPASFS